MEKAETPRPPARRGRFWVTALAIAAGVALVIALALDWKRATEAAASLAGSAMDATERSPTAPPVVPAPAGRRRVVVRVVDAAGEPVRGALVFAQFKGGARRIAEEFEPGQHSLSRLPEGSVILAAEVSGNRYRMSHPTNNPAAEIPLPNGGRVAVDWALPEKFDLKSGRVMLVFEPRGDHTDRFEVPVPPTAENRGSLMLPYVVPGLYLAQLEQWRESAQAGSPAVVLPLTTALEVSVREHSLTRIKLGLQKR